jgi:hypothetical protein
LLALTTPSFFARSACDARPAALLGDDVGHLGQNPAAHSATCLGRQSAALVIAQTEPASAQLLAKDTVFFAKVVDDVQWC